MFASSYLQQLEVCSKCKEALDQNPAHTVDSEEQVPKALQTQQQLNLAGGFDRLQVDDTAAVLVEM